MSPISVGYGLFTATICVLTLGIVRMLIDVRRAKNLIRGWKK